MTETDRRRADWQRRYGPWALVTGASDGIGAAVARELAAQGLDLILVARRRNRLEALAAELVRAHGVRAEALPADLGRADEVARVLAATEHRDVGLLVASAGFGTSGRYLETDAADELAMIDLNCRAVQQIARAQAEAMAARGRGGIVLLSSIAAFQGVPRQAAYAATKAFVQTLAEGMARELAPKGIDVLAVAPGPVRTGFAARAGLTIGAADTPEAVARDATTALGRRRAVAPGRMGKLLSAALAPLPRGARSAIMGRVMAGMTERDGPGGG
ncbi:MAG: SDR family NAD(P)-dependent oxidoreductase [Shimia sp.]